MASSVLDRASDLGRKAVNRVETVLGDDAREAVRRVKSVARDSRADYRYITGNRGSSKGRKTAASNGRKSSGRGN
jgi:hypothetical protein